MKIQWSKDEIQDSIVRKEKGDKVMQLKRETGEKKMERKNGSLRTHQSSVFNTPSTIRNISSR